MRDVVLITIDSLRADHIGAYGYRRDTTPFLDGLSSDGHLFSRAFAHGQATRVSFPSILTSSSPLMYGGFDHITTGRTLISELLSDVGYRCAAFHSNMFLSAEFGYDRGFETFYDSKSEPATTTRIRRAIRKRLDQNGILYQFLQNVFDTTERHAGVELGSLYTTADELTDMAGSWLESTDADEPRFLWAHYMDVHHPYVPPFEHQLEFRNDPIPDRRAITLRRKMLEQSEEITDDELSELIDLYDAEIRFVDTELERLITVAREHLDEPVVIVTSDHGEEFREHGAFSHGTFHEEGVHVPLIVADNSESGRHDELVGLMDLGPTIAEYASTPVPENFYGYSLLELIRDGTWDRTSVIGESGQYPGEYDVFYRDDEWKYIREEGNVRLYHIPEDPSENTDVSSNYQQVISKINNELDKHEEAIASTYTEIDPVEVDPEVATRLKQLGYRMD